MFGHSIWLAYSTRFKDNVAIKVISKVKAPADYVEKCLPREILLLRKLRHPNLIHVYEITERSDRVFVVMEYAENGDLLDKIKTEKFIAEPLAGRWFHQLIDGIEYCHSRGVVHRDIKCENLLLDKRWNLKITDFGFAKRFKCKDDRQLCDTYCGSYAYACPEIVRGVPYNPRLADIWSCGVVLFVMVFGRLPFDDSNARKLLVQLQSLPPHFPLMPVVSHDCCLLIKKIITTSKKRLRISGIRTDPWFRRIYSYFGPRMQLAKQQEGRITFPYNVL